MFAQTASQKLSNNWLQFNEKQAYKLMNVSVWHLMSRFICIVKKQSEQYIF